MHKIPINDILTNRTNGLKKFGPSIFYQMTWLKIFVNTTLSSEPGPCSSNNGGCPQICLPGNSPQCLCADHYRYVNNSCSMVYNITDDITPPVFSNCNTKIQMVYLGACEKTAVFNYIVPQATDNSGTVIIKDMQDTSPPYQLFPGFYYFGYKAQDLSGNTAFCTMRVNVLSRKCAYPHPILRRGSSGSPSCSNYYGSIVNVTCPGVPGISAKIICTRLNKWVITGENECIPPLTTTQATKTTIQTTQSINQSASNFDTPTIQSTISIKQASTIQLKTTSPGKTESENQSRGSSITKTFEDGFIILIVVVIVVLIVTGLLLLRRYKRLSWPFQKARFRSSDETVMLANNVVL
uniref:HYR domain-containing protein n=1 Tax=Ciona savignyi TaxID=51511 RepID=H2Z0E3_CIOSA